MGLLLKNTPLHPGGQPRKRTPDNDDRGSFDEPTRLAELGVDYRTSSRMQALAEVPEEDFEQDVAAIVQEHRDPQILAEQAVPLAEPNKTGRHNPTVDNVNGRPTGNSSEYLTARIARDRPDVLADAGALPAVKGKPRTCPRSFVVGQLWRFLPLASCLPLMYVSRKYGTHENTGKTRGPRQVDRPADRSRPRHTGDARKRMQR
jgi:hypothetical protein